MLVAVEVAAYDDPSARSRPGLPAAGGAQRWRTIVSGVGQLKIQAPRVDDRRVDEQGQRFHFTSQILPPYLRRTTWLYLKGISTGDFSEALEALLGPDAPGLSATTVVRPTSGAASTRLGPSVTSAASLHLGRWHLLDVRLDDERQCLLVVMGALNCWRCTTAAKASCRGRSCSRT